MYSGKSSQTFRMNVLLPSSGTKRSRSSKHVNSSICLDVSLFDLHYGDSTFFQTVCEFYQTTRHHIPKYQWSSEVNFVLQIGVYRVLNFVLCDSRSLLNFDFNSLPAETLFLFFVTELATRIALKDPDLFLLVN